MSISVHWHLIPDGPTTIVKLTIEGELYVDTANAVTEAEKQMAQLISRISTHTVETIKEKLQADRWLGNWPRPEEPSP